MSDLPPGSMPPPPPPQQPGPTAAPPPAPYQPPPVLPTPSARSAGMIAQFTGTAGWSILTGVATIAVPLVFHYVFYFLAVIGLILGIVAVVRSKQVVGGIVGILLNVVGGVITLIGLFG